MATAARTFGLRETLLTPDALPPPPVRHALFAFLVTLAAILHLCTAGWSEIHNGVEGEYAGGARQMFNSDSSHIVPIRNGVISPEEPPLLYWALVASYKIFGVTVVAARVPIALATIALVALTFVIGERLSGYWRAFMAGLIQLCLCGGFLWGRMVTPVPLFAALVAGAILCLVSGYHDRRKRRWWFAGFWACTAFAYLAEGAEAVVFLGAIILLLALLFREARMRFPALGHWPGLLIFIAIVLPWHVWLQMRFPGSLDVILGSGWIFPFVSHLDFAAAEHVGIARFLLGHLLWWFPALPLVLPGLLFAWRRVIRPREIEFSDAVPLCWMAVGFIPLLFLPQRQHFESLPMWSAFSLWAACAWDRTSYRLRIAGIAAAAAVCATSNFALKSAKARSALFGSPFADATFGSALTIASTTAAIAAFAGAAYLLWRKQETLATALLFFGTIPVGLSAAEADARLGPRVSFGTVAQFLRGRLGDTGELIYEGSRRSGSSLNFYLRPPYFVVSEAIDTPPSLSSAANRLTEMQALDKFGAPHPVYLIIHKYRVPVWQERLTARYHIYHQVSTSGSYVVVNNQP
ncbi:MAG TPA: glycosyltransferase family 39 protein [Burkholderiaceae bacterium]|nr:glycosyltransferase family 39 protein [Burkholderiaceae bacterium]